MTSDVMIWIARNPVQQHREMRDVHPNSLRLRNTHRRVARRLRPKRACAHRRARPSPATAQAAAAALAHPRAPFGNPERAQRPDKPRRPLARLHRPARRRAERLCRAERRSASGQTGHQRPPARHPRYAFAFTGNHVLYVQDVGGDENFQVFLVDLATGEEKDAHAERLARRHRGAVAEASERGRSSRSTTATRCTSICCASIS